MEGMKEMLAKRIGEVKPNKNLHSELHAVVDEISSYFGERKKFGMYLGTVKRIGVERARRIFAEVKDSGATDPRKLFIWK
jgi:hypothetical protein